MMHPALDDLLQNWVILTCFWENQCPVRFQCWSHLLVSEEANSLSYSRVSDTRRHVHMHMHTHIQHTHLLVGTCGVKKVLLGLKSMLIYEGGL